jgi:hypothetical protein
LLEVPAEMRPAIQADYERQLAAQLPTNISGVPAISPTTGLTAVAYLFGNWAENMVIP